MNRWLKLALLGPPLLLWAVIWITRARLRGER